MYGLATNAKSNSAAVFGENLSTEKTSFGVLGLSNAGVAVIGQTYGNADDTASAIGVEGAGANGIGVVATSLGNIGISAYSQAQYAVYASTNHGPGAIYGTNASTDATAVGIEGMSVNGSGVYGTGLGNGATGVVGYASNGFGVAGIDDQAGIGVYGASQTGLAGLFNGDVTIISTLTVGSIVYSSDKRLKQDIAPIDGRELLARLSSLPISSWDYKTDATRRHIGPMAQDFYAAFGLNGTDDTHISEVDAIGVSMAAIQELSRQLKLKDDQVADLRAKLDGQAAEIAEINRQFADIQAALVSLQADSRTARR